MIEIADTEGRTAAEVMSRHVTTLPASATVAELRAYFAESASRKLAVIVEGNRFAGCIPAAGLPADADDDASVSDYAAREPTIGPDAPAGEARERALADPTQRLPVVEESGKLLGIVAIDSKRINFCGT